MPRWIFGLWIAIFLILGFSSLTYSWDRCGSKTLLLGKNAPLAAAAGMCD